MKRVTVATGTETEWTAVVLLFRSVAAVHSVSVPDFIHALIDRRYSFGQTIVATGRTAVVKQILCRLGSPSDYPLDLERVSKLSCVCA